MADFRKSIFVLAASLAVFGAATTASAQVNIVCNASVANPPLLRSEGLTELTGDVLLLCFGGSPTNTLANVQIFLNTNVTSRILANGGTEALLLVNDPGPTQQILGNNIFQGVLVAQNSIAFQGIVIPPAANGVSLRITNVRANANGLGVAGPTAPPNPVIETISISSSVTISNPNQTVGFVTRGLVLSGPNGSPGFITGISAFQQCANSGAVASGFAVPASAFVINLSDGVPTAFKLQGGGAAGTPGAVNNTESGLIPGTSAAGGLAPIAGAGQADFGTRVQLTFQNVGNGAIILVPTFLPANPGAAVLPVGGVIAATTTLAQLVGGSNGNNTTIGGNAYAQLTTTTGVATAIYEIVATNTSAIDTLRIPVFASFISNPGAQLPALGTVTVAATFSPISTVTTAVTAAGGNVPRFANTGAATNAFSINACATNLLFPFVTNIAGFDTGLAISNTSTDPFGTATQAGTCTLNLFPGGGVINTPNIASGTVYTTLLSSQASGFQGYMIATCRFQYAHGFAFLTDGFGGPGRGLSQGYLALVIPDINVTGGRVASPLSQSPANSGEQLGY